MLEWLNSRVCLQFSKEPEGFALPNHFLTGKQEAFVDNEINEHLTSGAIEECLKQPLCISPIGCVPKKPNKLRLTVDLQCLDAFSKTPKFQYESISTVCKQICPHDTLVTLDIKNGFQHIPIHPDHRKFLGIQWKGDWYQWKVLPFRFNGSPYFFCKTLQLVIQYLCQQGLQLVIYVDNILLVASPSEIENHKQLLLNTLIRLGWLVNWEESSLQPALHKEFIGYVVITESENGYPMVKVPISRMDQSTITPRVLAHITGQCIAITKAPVLESSFYEMYIICSVDDQVGIPHSCWTVPQRTT